MVQEYESALHHSHDNERTSMDLGSAGPCPETDCSPEAVLVAESSHLTAWQKLGVLFSDPEILIFFALAVLFGFATGTIDGYLFLYLDVLGKLPAIPFWESEPESSKAVESFLQTILCMTQPQYSCNVAEYPAWAEEITAWSAAIANMRCLFSSRLNA